MRRRLWAICCKGWAVRVSGCNCKCYSCPCFFCYLHIYEYLRLEDRARWCNKVVPGQDSFALPD